MRACSVSARRGRPWRAGQRGSTLMIAMILLTLVALAVASAYSLSVSNLLVVGNVQRSEEGQAAGLRAMEISVASQIKALPSLVLGAASPPAWPVADARNEDIDGDGQNDFEVTISTFRCLESVLLTSGYVPGINSTTGLAIPPPPTAYDTLWEFEGTVRDLRNAGARLSMAVGVRVQFTQAQLEAYCPFPS